MHTQLTLGEMPGARDTLLPGLRQARRPQAREHTRSTGAFVVRIPTPEGCFEAEFTEQGLCALRFPRPASDVTADSPEKALPARFKAWAESTTVAVRLVLEGKEPGEHPPLDLSAGTRFRQEVWGALCRIPRGETRTYGDIARAIGRPGAARAVGQACGANPVPLLVPCHRVLAAEGRLGGFSSGVRWKQLLLGREIR